MGAGVGGGIERKGACAGLAERGGAEPFFGLLISQGKVVALFRLGGGSKDGGGKLGAFEKISGKWPTPGRPFLLVLFPGTAGEVAADNAFDGEGLGGAAPREATGINLRRRHTGGNVEAQDMVRFGSGQTFKPEFRDGGK